MPHSKKNSGKPSAAVLESSDRGFLLREILFHTTSMKALTLQEQLKAMKEDVPAPINFGQLRASLGEFQHKAEGL